MIFSVTAFGYTQDKPTLQKGVVIDSLQVPSRDNRFSLYVPSNFDTNKKWPIVFGFDSSGKAGQLTRLYKAAAEEYGYIIAVSEFLENQKEKDKANYISFFMNHIASLYPIKQGSVYVTAIGEDTKAVSLLPVFYSTDVFGVISIGDSYYYDASVKIRNNFSYLGIVNTNNFRYKNFLRNEKYLKKKSISADVFAYQGKSELPPPDLLKKALSTLTLHAMGKGSVQKDSTWIQNLFNEQLKKVTSLISKREFLSAYDEVERLRNEYSSFLDTEALKEKQKTIKKSIGYKQEKRIRAKYLYKETYLRQTYSFSLDEDVATKRYENLGWWQYQMSELDILASSKEKYANAMANRVKGFLKYLINNYTLLQQNENKNFEKRMFLNILSTIVDKKDFKSYLKIISLSAQDEDYKTALFYLDKLLQNGYKDFEALYAIEGTLALKITKDYNVLIEKYLGKSKYFFSK